MSARPSEYRRAVLPFPRETNMKLFFDTRPSPLLPHLRSLAECLGIPCEAADVAGGGLLRAIQRETAANPEAPLVLDAASLRQCKPDELAALMDHLDQSRAKVLIVASESSETVNRILRALTREAVGGPAVVRADRVSFSQSSKAYSQQLAGFSFAREPGECLGLDLANGSPAEIILSLDRSPAFVLVKTGQASVFIWTTNTVFDALRPLAAEKEFERVPDQYIPAMIFLRHTCGDGCWHNPTPGAGLVIDDPLLKKSYGFIDFSKLLESARRRKYHVTLAFIPWNHWRSSPARARMFVDYADCFSICAHGCDHTNREYGSADYEDLLGRNFMASQRMGRHRERTGVASEPLMVCPQEQYSLEAMRAFADSRQFVGLCCTACMPRNLPAPQIRGADLLLPAQDSFFGFPVFKRHYWTDISIFAMALFLGKPAILVEHHEFFRDGPAGAEKFVSELAALRPDLQWTSLAETARRTHWRRRLSAERHEVRFFTDDFKLEHGADTPAEYRLLRRVPETSLVRRVTANGQEIPFAHEGDSLGFDLRPDARQSLQVRVEVAPVRPHKEYSHGLKYQAAVAFRRGLSEFRDNVIARNNFILRAAKTLARKMKQTSH